MKTFAITLSASTMLALAACSGGSDSGTPSTAPGEEQSAEEVASEMEKVSLMPGEWESTSEVIDVQIEGGPEGMPAGIADMMKGRKTVTKNCITPEQAANPSAEFLTTQKDNKCTYSDFAMKGGTMTGKVSCPAGDSGKADMAMKGSYTPDSYDMTMNMNAAGMGGGAPAGMTMVMTVRTSGKRIGECPENGQ